MRRVAILGGTKGMGRALARRFVERGDWVALLGRDADNRLPKLHAWFMGSEDRE